MSISKQIKFYKTYQDFNNLQQQKNLNRSVDDCFYKYDINFATNDYLLLSKNELIKCASIEAINKFGNSSSSSRVLLRENNNIYNEVEKKIANFLKTEECLILSSGYQTNSTVIPALLNSQIVKNAVIFIDRLCHNSIYLGVQNSRVKFHRYKNCDLDHLELLLKKNNNSDPKFIITESIFSMDGSIVDIKKLVEISNKYNCFLYIDDAHSVGVYGENGRGLCEDYVDEIDMIVGTFSKSFGCFGGYVACSYILKKYLINKCYGLIYSTALPCSIIAGIDKSVEIIQQMTQERETILELSKYFRENLRKNQFNITDGGHIIGLIISDNKKIIDRNLLCLEYEKKLFNYKINCSAIRSPTVPVGTERIRFSINSGINKNNLDYCIECLIKIRSELI
jgi:8-amino-7-oxononanoate synthase